MQTESDQIQSIYRENVTLNSFVTISLIGKGSYGKVLLVRKKDNNKLYALKILSKKKMFEKNQERHVINEKEILVKMNRCPFLVQFYYAFQTPKKLYFVLEFCPGGELFTLIQKRKRLTEGQARFYACQVVLALEALHHHNVVYRDLKPENVVLDNDGYIKLTDFGLSKQNVINNDARSICGTPEYLAPEQINKQQYGKIVDWWALGCLIYEMVTGVPPFYKNNRFLLFETIKNENPKLPSCLTQEGQNILNGLLTKDPLLRLGYLNDAEDVKQHKWFQGVNWEYLYRKKYAPPFRVNLGKGLGLENFDQCFTGQDPESMESEEYQNHMTNFTWEYADKSYNREIKIEFNKVENQLSN